MNECIFSGMVGNDIELRKTESEKNVLSLSLAVSRGKDSEGEYKKPLWISCTAWEHKAEFIARNIKKGDKIFIRSLAVPDNYVNENGKETKRTVYTIKEIELCPKAEK